MQRVRRRALAVLRLILPVHVSPLRHTPADPARASSQFHAGGVPHRWWKPATSTGRCGGAHRRPEGQSPATVVISGFAERQNRADRATRGFGALLPALGEVLLDERAANDSLVLAYGETERLGRATCRLQPVVL